MLRVATHRKAAAETIVAALYYDRQVPGLGGDLLVRYDALVTEIRGRPRRFRAVARGVRKAHLTRFPYAVYFELFTDRVHILAVAHQHRRPYYWMERRAD